MHETKLAALARAEHRTTYLGFTMTYAVARNAVVSLVTLGVAVWGILRGAGVTIESYCPVG
jgi:hypothetical protein